VDSRVRMVLCFPETGVSCQWLADGTIHRWSMDPAQAGRQPDPCACQWPLEAVVMAPRCATLAGLRHGGVWLGQVEGTAARLSSSVGQQHTCLLFSRDGTISVAGAQSGEIQIWALISLNPCISLRGWPGL